MSSETSVTISGRALASCRRLFTWLSDPNASL